MSRRRSLTSSLVTGVVTVATVGACSAGSPGDLSASAARILSSQVQHVREVAATHDFTRLQAAVDELKSLVDQERRAGQVSDTRAAAIDDAADTLVEDSTPPAPTPSPMTESPTPSPTPTPTPTPTPSPTTTSPTPVVSVSAGNAGGGGGGGGGGQGGLPAFSQSPEAAFRG